MAQFSMEAWLEQQKGPTSFADDAAIWNEFDYLVGALSPENLTCDGERSRSEVQKELKRLKGRWARAEKALGRSVDEHEVWDRIVYGRIR